MLPPANRLTDGEAFRRTVRRGARAGSRTLVAHLVTADAGRGAGAPPRVGLVVSKAVGNAVVRNRVKRRVRHLARGHLAVLGEDSLLVLRAQPSAAGASHEQLAGDLERCVARCRRQDAARSA